MNRILLVISLLFTGILNLEANDNTDEQRLAFQTVQSWQKLWDSNDVLQTKQYIAKSMQKTLSIVEIQSALSERRAKLGTLLDRTLLETVPHGRIYSFPQGDYIAFIFSSNYENKSNTKELVRVIKEDGRWLIFGDLLLEKGQRAVGNY